MDKVYFNGKIYVEREIFADAMLIRGQHIKKIGTYSEVTDGICDFDSIDLDGKTVIPGFNDSHCHILSLGVNLYTVRLGGCKSIAEIIQRGQDFLKKHPDTTFMSGNGWNQDYFEDNISMPTRQDLDKITTEIPIIFSRTCGHICVTNTKALEVANIDRNTPAVYGGVIYTDENGEPNGLFCENSIQQVKAIVPPYTKEKVSAYLKASMEYCASYGITSVQTGDFRQGNTDVVDQGYKLLYATFENAIRTYQQTIFTHPEEYLEFVRAGYVTGSGDDMYKIGPLKMFIDGSLGARTALLLNPYLDEPSTCGVSTMTQQHLENMVKIAHENHCQTAIHCIGDGAMKMVLDAYDKVISDVNDRRHGIIHCQITDKEIIDRFEEKDILAYLQPIFIDYDMNIVYERVGTELANSSYAFGDMYRRGIKTSYGTDAPVEDTNPYNNIYCAVTRKCLDGTKEYLPSQKVDIFDAIDQYTHHSAYASFEEDYKGRLKEGYLADFVVLDADIFTVSDNDILKIRPLKTYISGREVYSK